MSGASGASGTSGGGESFAGGVRPVEKDPPRVAFRPAMAPAGLCRRTGDDFSAFARLALSGRGVRCEATGIELLTSSHLLDRLKVEHQAF